MIFVDTGAFIALYNVRDQYHDPAVEGWDRIAAERTIAVTSSLVVNETLTLLARRAGYAFAAARGRSIYASERLTVLRSTHEDEVDAISYLEKYADQKMGFTDCVSMVLMHKRRIRDAFTFDRHFELAGFKRFPTA
jgi:uncharacterized protein